MTISGAGRSRGHRLGDLAHWNGDWWLVVGGFGWPADFARRPFLYL